MIPRSFTRRGVALAEVLVALSIIATLSVLAVASAGGVREHLFEAECRAQLAEINIALVKYRQDNGGQDPHSLESLVPAYLAEDKLVCPWVKARAPEAVAKLRQIRRNTPFVYWASYFRFSRPGLDELYQRGETPISYSDVLRERAGSTPAVVCYDHREPWSVRSVLTRPEIQAWRYPERPVIVLRNGGRVDTSHYGGIEEDGFPRDTMADAANL